MRLTTTFGVFLSSDIIVNAEEKEPFSVGAKVTVSVSYCPDLSVKEFFDTVKGVPAVTETETFKSLVPLFATLT